MQIAHTLRTGTCVVLLFWFATLSWAEPCRAPESMRQRLEDHPTAETFADLGIWFGEHQKYACAADAFGSSLSLEPKSANVAFMFGASLYLSGNAEEAIAPLRVSEDLEPLNKKLHPVLAAALDDLQQTKKAEEEWRIALRLDPDLSTALDGLSRDLILDSDYAGTIALLANPIIRGQRTAVQSMNLGLAYARTNRYDEAVETLRDGFNTSPDSLTIATELAHILLQLERLDEANTVVDLALALDPGDAEAPRVPIAIGSAKAHEGGDLRAASRNWKVLYLSGVAEVKEGRLLEARADLQESVALNPNFAHSRRVLGSLLVLLKDLSGGKEQLEKAIALGDNSAEMQDKLSKVLRALADRH